MGDPDSRSSHVGEVTQVILIVLDGVGVGELPDAAKYGDAGSNTLGHVAEAVGGLQLPNLERLGLSYIGEFKGVRRVDQPEGCFGKMQELSVGKDTTLGHWEMTGVVRKTPLPTYPSGFPAEVIEPFERSIGRSVLGNRPASGTVIIQELGEEHLRTGFPIVYTSADSVFQIAAHEDVVPVEELYRICRTARKLLGPSQEVGRVIARPFIGMPGAFVRTERRRDFSVEPLGETVLDRLVAAGHPVVGLGKIDDLFAGRGLTRSIHTGNNAATFDEAARALKSVPRGLIFANLVDFDMGYGHRNDVAGYAKALQALDQCLPEVIEALRRGDVLCLTADHGNDPTHPGTDHTREHVPLLVYGPRLARGVNLGTRRTFADVGQTLADAFGVGRLQWGDSFLDALLPT
jgi:phosphopentomutase